MIAILKKILDYGVEAKHIAMLTPYSKQVALLKSLIQENSLQAPDVSTVDGIQGR
jgi:superfamily I DNA and/or RNA helicase